MLAAAALALACAACQPQPVQATSQTVSNEVARPPHHAYHRSHTNRSSEQRELDVIRGRIDKLQKRMNDLRDMLEKSGGEKP